MQRTSGFEFTGLPIASGPARTNRFLATGVVLASTGLIALNPGAAVPIDVQHRPMQLTAGAEDLYGWSSFAEHLSTNLGNLAANSNVAAMLEQITSNQGDYAQLIMGMEDVPLDARPGMAPRFITSGFLGIQEAWEKMLDGVEGQDIKYPGLEELWDRMTEDFQQGNPFEAFNELNIWLLYGIEEMGKAMGPVLSIPARMMENLSSVVSEFFGPLNAWAFIKAFSQTLMAPTIGVFYQLTQTITQVAGGDLEALLNAPAALANALINGYEVPETGQVFVGLLNNDSLFDLLLVDWPARIAEALTVGTDDLPVNAVDPGLLADSFSVFDSLF